MISYCATVPPPLQNIMSQSNNSAAISIAGHRLVPLLDALLGQAPPAGDFPSTTDELIAWGTYTDPM